MPTYDETLPEDLVSALTPAQAQHNLQMLMGRQNTLARRNPSAAQAMNPEIAQARKAWADALARDREIQAEYGPRDSFWDDLKRQFLPDALLTDVGRNADIAGRNVAGMTVGGPVDVLSVLGSVPLGGPGVLPPNAGMAMHDLELAAQTEFNPLNLPYNSEYWIKAFGGDIDHPSALPAAFLAPTGGELAAGIRALSDMPQFMAAVGPHFWKILKGADEKFMDEIWGNEFTRRRFIQEVPGAEYRYGTIQIPEESMEAARAFAEARGLSFTENMHRFDPPMQGPTFQFRDETVEVAEDVAETGTRFTRKETPHYTPEPSDSGKFRISRFRSDAAEAEGAARQGAAGLGKDEFVVNAGDKSRPGQLRSDFEVDADRMYDLRADPDNLWEQTYTGPGQDINDRIDDYHKLIAENYDAGWIYEDEFRAVAYRDLPPATPRSFASKRFTAVQGERSGEFVVQNWDDAAAGARDTDFVIRSGEHGYEIVRTQNLGIRHDNPGGDWLKHERNRAEQNISKGHKASGAITAHTANFTDSTKPAVMIDPKKLKDIPGYMDEHLTRGTGPKADRIRKWMGKEEWRDPITINVNHRGEVFIAEGNNRLAVALEQGMDEVPIRVAYYAGGETVDGAFSPQNLSRMTEKTVNDRPLSSFTRATHDLIDDTSTFELWGVKIHGKDLGDTWVIHRMVPDRPPADFPIQGPARAVWGNPLEAFRDLLANADLGGKTIVFDDPAQSMLGFRRSSYMMTERELSQIPDQDLFELGGGWGKMLREQFGFKQTKDGSWVRLPDPNARRGFTNPDYALQFLDEFY